MADISKITLPSGTTYDIKDSQARSDISLIQSSIAGGVNFIGETTTAIADQGTTSTIKINGENVNVTAGNLVYYNKKEFLWEGSKWIEMGDLTSLGSLAYKSNASTTYTPSGTVSQPTFTGSSITSTGNYTPNGTVSIEVGSGTANYTPAGTVSAPTISVKNAGTTTTVNSITDVGTLPSLTTSVSNETLTIAFNTGTLPTKGSNTTVKTGDATYTASTPSFTGSGAELTASFTGTQGSVSVSGTTAGTVSQPTFSGTQATITTS